MPSLFVYAASGAYLGKISCTTSHLLTVWPKHSPASSRDPQTRVCPCLNFHSSIYRFHANSYIPLLRCCLFYPISNLQLIVWSSIFQQSPFMILDWSKQSILQPELNDEVDKSFLAFNFSPALWSPLTDCCVKGLLQTWPSFIKVGVLLYKKLTDWVCFSFLTSSLFFSLFYRRVRAGVNPFPLHLLTALSEVTEPFLC